VLQIGQAVESDEGSGHRCQLPRSARSRRALRTAFPSPSLLK
jgi:hypothetical protein